MGAAYSPVSSPASPHATLLARVLLVPQLFACSARLDVGADPEITRVRAFLAARLAWMDANVASWGG